MSIREEVLKDLDTAYNARVLDHYLEELQHHRAAVRAGRPSEPPDKPTVPRTKQREAWETSGTIVRHFDAQIRVR